MGTFVTWLKTDYQPSQSLYVCLLNTIIASSLIILFSRATAGASGIYFSLSLSEWVLSIASVLAAYSMGFISLLYLNSFPPFSFIHLILSSHPSQLNLFNYSRFLFPIHIATHTNTHVPCRRILLPAIFGTVFMS